MRIEGIWGSLRRLAADPRRLLDHSRRIARGDATGRSNRYGASASRAADILLVARALGVAEDVAERAIEEIETDEAFVTELRERYRAVRPEWAAEFDLGRFKTLYALIRLRAPRTVIETGVHDGLSSAMILRALQRNGSGSLTSIDLPSTDLPVGVSGPGWLVPAHIAGRWTLLLGDSRKLLPEAVATRAPVDVFIHDSDHSRAFRDFEFRTARESLSEDGLLISDDDEPPDTLLDELGAEWSMTHLRPAAADPGRPMIGLLVPSSPRLREQGSEPSRHVAHAGEAREAAASR